jgi:2-phosphoglycerate kinase
MVAAAAALKPSPMTLPTRLRHVRWIGGGSGAGKTTVARRIAERHSLHLYSTDDRMADHVARTNPVEAPLLQAFLAMDMDERWANRSPSMMLETFHWFQGEGFDLMVEDMLALAGERRLVLVEGFRLLPRLVAPLISDAMQAVWLLPTPDFRRTAFDSRGFTWSIPRHTTDPERALANLLERDRLFTNLVAAEARRLGLRAIEVNGDLDVEALSDRVARCLGLA